MKVPNQIPTFLINLKERTDRKAHILQQFEGREEFNLTLVNAVKRKNGRIGLWQTIIKIIKQAQKEQLPYVLICEDDHTFTKSYNKDKWFKTIDWAQSQNIELLSGGVSWFSSTLQLTRNLFWVDNFSGFQFTIIFNSLFDKILNAAFLVNDAADYKIASLTDKIVILYPFISIQNEFGYSDVTPLNNQKNHVKQLFQQTRTRLKLLKKVAHHYGYSEDTEITVEDLEGVCIPTYVINLPERKERLEHIKEQFKNKPEFDVQIIEACKHKIGAVGLWDSIKKVIALAQKNDDDVIIICEDDHTFTNDYNKSYLLQNIIAASNKGADVLNLGVGGFNQVIPVTKNLYWIDNFWNTQFVVVYRSFFHQILSEPFSDVDTADGKLSEMSSNTFALYPFVSVQQDFGYSDVTASNHKNPGLITRLFEDSATKLELIRNTRRHYYGDKKHK